MTQKLFLLLAFIAVCYAAPTKQEEELLARVADILGAAQEESQAKANFFPSNAADTSQLLNGLLRGVVRGVGIGVGRGRDVGRSILNRITNPSATANQFSSWTPFADSQQDDGRNRFIDIATLILNTIKNNGNEDTDEANSEGFSISWSPSG